MIRKKFIIAGSVAALLLGGTVVAFAQSMHHDMGGPMMRICKEADQKGSKLLERIQRVIKPTDAQKVEFEAFKVAVTTAEAGLSASCPKQGEAIDRTPPGRLAAMETHLAAMLTAVKTVRPAADALYAKLDDKQRDALRWAMPFGMGEHHPRKDHHKMMDEKNKPAQ